MQRYDDLEKRVISLENSKKSIDDLVELLEDVRSALKVFVKIGNAFKWLAALIAAGVAGYFAIKKALGIQ